MDTIMQQLYRSRAYTARVAPGVVSVASYVRISFDRKGKRHGVSDQRQDVVALIEGIPGLEVGEVYEDNDVSAFKQEVKREAYNRLIADIKAGKYTAVACVRGSRLVRQRVQRAEFIDLMQSVGGKVYTTDGTVYDFTSEVGRGQFDSDGAKDTSESEKISVRTTRSHLRQAEQGVFAGGPVPYGLKRHLEIVDGEIARSYRINEDQAEILREAARRVLSGDTIHAIVTDFNRRGVPTASGGRWWDRTVLRYMLLRPGIAGLRSHHSHDNIMGRAEWDAIIEPDQWMAVKSTLETRAGEHRKTANDVKNLLAGFLVCATCGHKMRNGAGKNRTRTYHCSAPANHCTHKMSINADPLDALIGDLFATKLAETASYTANEPQTDPAAKVAELTAKLDQLADQWADGELTDQAYAAATRATEKKIAAQRAEAEKNAKVLMVLPGPHAATAWESGTLAERRGLLEMLVIRIVIGARDRTGRFGNVFDPDRVTVVWRSLGGAPEAS